VRHAGKRPNSLPSPSAEGQAEA